MRWTHNDTLAYQAVTDAGERVRKLWDQYQAGQAGSADSQVTDRQGMQEQGAPDQNMVYDPDTGTYIPKGGFDPSQTDIDSLQTPKYAMTGQTQYKLGSGDWQGTAPTQQEVLAARLRGMANYHLGQGNTEEGISTLLKGQQLQLGGYQLGAAQRQADTAKRIDDVAKAWANPEEKLKQLYNTDTGQYGQGNNAGKQGNLLKMPNGNYLVWQTDENGQPKMETTQVVPQSVIQNHMMRAYLADLASADPDKFAAHAADLGIKAEELDMHRRHYKDAGEHWARGDANDAERNRITERVGMAQVGARSSYVPKYAPAGALPDGTLFSISSDGSPAINTVTGQQLTAAQQAMAAKLTPKVSGERSPKDPKIIESLSQQYAAEVAGAKPENIPAIQEKYRQAGLDSLGESVIDKLARAKAAQSGGKPAPVAPSAPAFRPAGDPALGMAGYVPSPFRPGSSAGSYVPRASDIEKAQLEAWLQSQGR